jgi:D-alanyl-D-alanine dipeptidase
MTTSPALTPPSSASPSPFPDNFIYLSTVDSTIIQSVRYATTENFIGAVVRGYDAPKVVCKRAVAAALSSAQQIFKSRGYSLVVYDAYRPHRATDHFFEWASTSSNSMRAKYYPTVPKEDFFRLGYVAKSSNHCTGCAVDVTLIRSDGQLFDEVVPRPVQLQNGESVLWLDDGTVDMGTGWDLMHDCSSPESNLVSEKAQANRKLLQDVMVSVGFEWFPLEWWHFNFPPEQYDFVIT